MRRSSPVDEEKIHALVDNQLSQEDEIRVRADIQRFPESRKLYKQLCQQKNLLKNWWRLLGNFH